VTRFYVALASWVIVGVVLAALVSPAAGGVIVGYCLAKMR
jgi:hypothetical protein